MTAIIVKFLNCTNTKPYRLKATMGSGFSRIYSYDQATNDDRSIPEAYMWAARQLVNELGWKGKLQGGEVRQGYAFTLSTTELKEK